MELSAKVIGVEQAFDGIIIVIQQDKMQIPVAEEPECDESIFMKKMTRSLRGIGLNVDVSAQQQAMGFRTGFWCTVEDYEALGKPTIGDVLKFKVDVEEVIK